ncbi:NFX1-type zinc finger-containing protein 1-like [Gigantopelta aegis]|uniref:NFX1-type zinc finger-containing protein 1-like n=1 Tax=Gigantopelta aegis TaxID=1735272 RepID=UPI001B888913|nr:NFX1-type zinc finger-containing protein 1-like [Gigantopelta aegis]
MSDKKEFKEDKKYMRFGELNKYMHNVAKPKSQNKSDIPKEQANENEDYECQTESSYKPEKYAKQTRSLPHTNDSKWLSQKSLKRGPTSKTFFLSDGENDSKKLPPSVKYKYETESKRNRGREFETKDTKKDLKPPSHPKQNTKCLTVENLLELTNQDAQSVLLTLGQRDNGFLQILNQPALLVPDVCLIIKLLAKSCSNQTQSKEIIKLLVDVDTSLFMSLTIPSVLAKLSSEVSDQTVQTLIELVADILDFLTELSTRMPHAIIQISGVLSLVETSLSSVERCGMAVPNEVVMKTKQLTNTKASILKRMQTDRLKANKKVKLPDDFRTISIMPTYDDVFPTKPPFIRKIKATGGYSDVTDYLDVQFRLLHEDFIQPLRQGIKEYLIAVDNPRQYVSVRTYNEVVILKQDFIKANLVHTLTFDTSKLKHVQWDYSKRLKYGTLVCLSSDNFKTFSVATVESEKPKMNELGTKKKKQIVTVDICIQQVIGERRINMTKPMVMLETPAYFEAYRHVLASLQNIKDGQLPFEDYIVHCKTDVKPPAYLRDKPNVKYNFGLETHKCKRDEERKIHDSSLKTLLSVEIRNNSDENVVSHQSKNVIDDGDLNLVSDETQNIGDDGGVNDQTNDSGDLNMASGYKHRDDCDDDISNGNLSNKAVCGSDHRDRTCRNLSQSEDQNDTKVDKTETPEREISYGFHEQCTSTLNVSNSLVMDETHVTTFEHPQTNDRYKTVEDVTSVLQLDTWPQPEDLNLDVTQFKAFQQALTKEFVIMQGPPGTGKTYVGLKIVETLLSNAAVWQSDPRPMLIICYTNHALDQFLEGILSFHTGHLVRVGSKCKNEKVKQYGIKTMQEKLGIHTMYSDTLRDDYVKCQRSLLETQKCLEMLHDGIVKTKYFNPCIKKSHYDQLTQTVFANWTLLVWLDLLVAMHVSTEKKQYVFKGGTKIFEDTQTRLHDQSTKKKSEETFEELMSFPGVTMVPFRMILNEISPKHSHYLNNEIHSSSMMTEEEAMSVKDIWSLQNYKRWRLYRFWVHGLEEHLENEFTKMQEQCVDIGEQYRVAKLETHKAVMKRCSVIGMTTTAAARYQKVLSEIKPRIIVIEEAAEILEGHVIASLSSECQHLILIGDHQQLRPSTNVYTLAKRYNLELSLFERMVKNGLQCICLEKQHRMRPSISRIVKHIYPDLRDDASVQDYPNIMGVFSNVFFISHSEPEEKNEELISHLNIYEAKYVIALCLYLIKQGYSRSRITVLTTYSAQVAYLKRNMAKETFQGVMVTDVDNYQGEENDIILLSLVRSNLEGNVGFLKIDNRVCVALSRAKHGLYVIGNFEILSKQSDLWKNIIDDMKSASQVGNALGLYCQNHPSETGIKASKAGDFSLAPEGGCMKRCLFRLDCGHVCASRCHPVDPNHLQYKCQKPCEKILCDLQHQCPDLCYEDCQKCVVLVTKVIPSCQHEQEMLCSINPVDYKCQERCEKILCDLQHQCPKLCFEDCPKCVVLVKKVIPSCQHEQEMPCSINPVNYNCQEPCEKILCDLQHQCPKLCFEDCPKCVVHVKKVIPSCQHEQEMPCSINPVDYNCQERCEKILCDLQHQCPDLCYEKCKECAVVAKKTIPSCQHEQDVPCSVDLKHFQCMYPVMHKHKCGHETEVPCSMKETVPCVAQCNAILMCGHTCKGLCQECLQGRLHVACTEPCDKVLICGHTCRSVCSSCPPCELPCENRCVHGTCNRRCGEHCIPCKEPCQWRCNNRKCNKKCINICSDVCSRIGCNNICPRKLKCGHRCIGLCGEKCPALCKVCNKDEVSKCRYDMRNKLHIPFVELDDCGHIVEVVTLDKIMEDRERSNKIQLKWCPWCKTCIRHSLRYGESVKKTIQDIHIIKTQMIREKLKMYKYIPEREMNSGAVATLEGRVACQRQASIMQSIRQIERNIFVFCSSEKRQQFVQELKDFRNWISKTRVVFSQQEDFDAQNELKRLNLIINVQKYELSIKTKFNFTFSRRSIHTKISDELTEKLELAKQYIWDGNPYTPDRQQKVAAVSKELASIVSASHEMKEDEVSVTAMKFSVDHWLKCKQGHVFYVDVAGADVPCPKCSAKLRSPPSTVVESTKKTEVDATRSNQRDGTRNNQRDGTHNHQRDSTRNHQRDGTRNDGIRNNQRDGTRDNQRDGTRNHQRDGTRNHQRAGTWNNQRDGTRNHQRDGTRNHQRDGTRNNQRDGTHNHQRDSTRNHQRDGTRNDGIRNHQRDGTRNNQRDGTRNTQRDGTRNNQRDGTHNHQPDGTRNHQLDGTRNNQRDGTRNNQRDGTCNYQRDGTRNNQRDGTWNNQRDGTCNNQRDGTQTSEVDGMQRTEEVTFPRRTRLAVHNTHLRQTAPRRTPTYRHK